MITIDEFFSPQVVTCKGYTKFHVGFAVCPLARLLFFGLERDSRCVSEVAHEGQCICPKGAAMTVASEDFLQ